MPPEPHEFEFAIVCALPREFDAVEALLDEHYSNIGTLRHHGDSNYYQTGRMGVSNVVVVCLLDMGKASAAGAAASLRSSFPNISLTLVVGICGGVPFPAGSLATEMILGDVVISHQVVKFDSGRQYPDRFERRGVVKETLDRSNWAVLSLLAGLPTREMRGRFGDLHNRFLHGLQKDPVWAYPGVEKDRLFPASCEHKAADGPGSPTDCDSVGCAGPHIPRKRLSGSTNPRPWIHLGPIASGDAVMKSAHHRDRLAREESIVGFEMEGAGVGEVLSSVVIKGVCDYADSHKNKEWQDYAAASGAGCAKALLECLTQTTYERCAVFMSSGIVQKGLGVPRTIVTQSSYYASNRSVAAAVTGYSHRSNQPAMGPTAPLRQHGTTQDGLEPAIMHEADAPHREIVTGNQLIQSTPYKTFFGTFYYRAQAIQKRVAVEDESSEHTEIKRTIIFHPASWFRRLGVHYGFNAFANYQRQSWQYGLRPVHVIPDDSLVFRFCETGNVDAVREMLIHGEASIYDADTRGWTLLHVAVKEGRSQLVKFLMAHGASKRAFAHEVISSYSYHHEPATFMKGTDFKQEHVQVLSLFADCLEFSGPQSNGWLLVPNDAEEWQGSEPLTPQLSREWYSILLRKYRDDCARTFDAKGLFYALKLVHDRGDFDSINMLLDFVPDQRSYTELLSGDFFGRPFEYFLRDCFLVHEALLERVPNLRVFGKETPTSRSLRFSAIFLEWRSTIQGLYPNINSLIDKELTERHAPSLSGWDHDTLGALWALDFKEWPHFEVSYAADETACSYCGARGLMCDIEDTRCMLEPWWEELKHHVRTRSCLCSKREWLQNDHEPENHDHGLYEDMLDEFDDNDKQGGQGNTPSLGETSTLTDGTIDDSPGDSPDETGSFARVVSRHSADGASPSIQSEGSTGYCSDSSCETDSDLPFELVLRAYYAIYGPWKGEYNPGQCFCFRCFAKLEGWDIEFPPDETSSERSDESEADDTSSQSSDYDDDQEGESDVSDDSDEGDEVDTGNDCNALEAQKEAEAKEEHVDPMGVD